MANQTLAHFQPRATPLQNLKGTRRTGSGNRTVALLGRCKSERGWRTYPVVYGTSGRMKGKVIPNRLLIGGKEAEVTVTHYLTRHYEGDDLKMTTVGSDPNDALVARQRREQFLSAKLEAAKAGIALTNPDAPHKPTVISSGRKTIAELKAAFLEKKAASTREDAGALYRLTLRGFMEVCNEAGKTYPEQIEELDVVRYCNRVEQGKSERTGKKRSARTRANRFTALITFLRYCVKQGSSLKLDNLLSDDTR